MADEPPPQDANLSNPTPVAQDGANDRSWERAWTLEEMRKNSDGWTLAGDAGSEKEIRKQIETKKSKLLLYLQEFSQKMISRTHEIEKEVANLIHESKLTGVRVNNAFNDFMMLANTQFVENRVYVDDEEIQEKTATEETKPEDQEKTREQREAELIPKVNEAIKLGVNVIEEAFEKLDTNVDNTDSEDEDETYKVDPILEAKDPYVDRLLPYMIGSPNFMNDDDVGLKDISDEESDAGSISESESEDEAEDDEKKREAEYLYSDDMSDTDNEESDAGSISESESEDEAEDDEKKREAEYSYSDDMSDTDSETEKKPSKKFIESDDDNSDSEGDLFNDNKKDSESNEDTAESDIDENEGSDAKPSAPEPVDFASELARKLGGGVAPPKPPSPKLAEEEDEEEAPKQTDFASELARKLGSGAALPKPPSPKLAEEEDEEEAPKQTDKQKKKKKKEKERKRAKSKSKERDDEDLFQPEKDNSDDDLFGGGMFAKKSGGLFDKDDESDEGDLFGDDSTKKRAPSVKKPKEENFVDEEEEEEEEKPKEDKRGRTESGKKIPAGGVSIFGGAGMKPSGGGGGGLFDDEEEDDLFNSMSKPKSSSITEKPAEKQTVAKSKESSGLFADDDEEDDLFSGKQAAPVVKAPSKQDVKKPSLFDDDDDDEDFTSSVKSEPKPAVTKEPPKKKLPAGAVSMFGPGGANPLAAALKKQRPQSDEEDDDWSDGNKSRSESLKSNKSRSESIKSNKSTASKSSTSSKPKSNSFSRNAKTTAGIFDDDEDDLFSTSTKQVSTKQVEKTKQQTEKPRSGSLFGDENEEEEDLFGSKPAAKPKEQTKKPPAGAVSMFPGGINPFGAKKQSEPELKKEAPKVEKKEEPVKKSTISLFGDDETEDGLFESGDIKPPPVKQPTASKPKSMFDDDDDDLFGSQQDDLFSKPPEPVKTKPAEPKMDTTISITKVTKPKATKPAGGASLFGDDEEEADLFAKPPTPRKQTLEDEEVEESKPKPKKPVGGVSMFGPGAGALLPGLKKKEEKVVEPAEKQEFKKEETKPAVKKTVDPLFGEGDEEEDLFGGGPVKKQEVKPVTKQEVDPVKPAPPPLESSKFEDSDDDDLFGAGKKEPSKSEEVEKPSSPVEVKPKRPVGGVNMFGGVNPFAGRIKKPSETDTQSSEPSGLSSPDEDLFGSPDQKPKVDIKKTEPVVTETKSPPKGKVGKLQANLNFNPAALLPGAGPPIKEPELLNIGFDAPAEARTLQSANKDRAKIQTKRRPPSRVARKRASAQSPHDTNDFFSPASPTSPTLSDEVDTARVVPLVSDSLPHVPSTETSKTNSSRKTDMFGNDDLFGASPPKSTTKSVIEPKQAISDDTDIFSSNTFGASKNKNTDNNIDDLFAPPPAVTSAIKSKTEQNDDLFSDLSKAVKDTKPKSKPLEDNDDDDDLFGSPSLSKLKTTSNVKKENISSENKPDNKAKAVILDDDDDDLFASPTLSKPKEKVPKEPKTTTTKTNDAADDDIFGDSSLNKKKVEQKKAEPAENGDDDIFATSAKDKKPKSKKAVTKDEDLFDDDTDIFNDIPKAKPKEKKVKKKAAAPKKQIFKDDIDDIFADTSSTTKPKEKKKTKKTTETTKTEDKSKTLDDIFDDPLK